MMFSREVFKRWGRVGALAVSMGAALAACGGGEQKETFNPARILVFGDENSLITPAGRQYTTNNGKAASGTTAAITPCTANPVWVQVIAVYYGRTFAECTGAAADPAMQMRATFGATVATTRAAVTAANVGTGDLVTLMVGSHELVALWEANKNPTTPQLTAMTTTAKNLGRDLGDLVLTVTGRGAKIVFSTVPNLGTAPIAITSTGIVDPQISPILTALSTAFNDGLSDRVSDDPNGGGRSGVVVEADQLIERYRRNNEGIYVGFSPSLYAACVVNNAAVPPVTTADAALVTDCDTSIPTSVRTEWLTALWAGRFQFGVALHAQLGADTFQRIRNNPL